MPDGSESTRGTSAFNWALGTPERIETYLIECRATRDPDIIRDAEYLVGLAREHLGLDAHVSTDARDNNERAQT